MVGRHMDAKIHISRTTNMIKVDVCPKFRLFNPPCVVVVATAAARCQNGSGSLYRKIISPKIFDRKAI
jgi:hypothetical protein